MFEEKANPQAIDTLGDFFMGRMNIEHLHIKEEKSNDESERNHKGY
jgi:hypothetical protein